MLLARRKKFSVNPNITPLIDIVFLLLLFFILTYHVVKSPGIKLTLPVSTTARSHPEDRIIVTISEENQVYLNEKELDISELLGQLKKEVEISKDKIVIIKADEKIDLGLAVRVMDIAKQAEAKDLVISTQEKMDDTQ